MATTSLKLSDELKQRAIAAAEKKGVSPHAFMERWLSSRAFINSSDLMRKKSRMAEIVINPGWTIGTLPRCSRIKRSVSILDSR